MRKIGKMTSVLLVLAMVLCIMMTGCGKKIEAGDYTGSVACTHSLEVESSSGAGPGGGAGGSQTVDQWGCNVTITVDEDGIIWNIVASAPEGATLWKNNFAATVSGGKFTGSITGVLSCEDIMKIKVDTEDDGFPVMTGDAGGIHLAEGQNVTLLHDEEQACALIILAIQDAIRANDLA